MLLDIGAGILIALGLVPVFDISHVGIWVLAGAAFALLPDIDALVNLVQYRGAGHEYRHRDLLHHPLPFISAGVLMIFPFSHELSILFALCALAHFAHDSIGLGWGVQWLSPFSSDHFSFLYLYQPPGKVALPRRYLYRWRHADIDALDRAHGDHDWIRHIYVQMHPFALTEFAVFGTALAVLYIVLK